MAITLEFNVKPGDTFRYRATFTTRRDGKTTTNSTTSGEQIVAVVGDCIHIVQLDDPDALVTVLDRRGYPVDVLQGGKSVKSEMGEMFDISNRVIFPPGPVNLGDSWEADDGVVHVTYRLVGASTLAGREIAEVHATEPSYYGPLKHIIELSTGRPYRTEYVVGEPDAGTTTVIERA